MWWLNNPLHIPHNPEPRLVAVVAHALRFTANSARPVWIWINLNFTVEVLFIRRVKSSREKTAADKVERGCQVTQSWVIHKTQIFLHGVLSQLFYNAVDGLVAKIKKKSSSRKIQAWACVQAVLSLVCESSPPSLTVRFLTYCPAKRISADEALKHEYFRETPLPIEPAMFPTWPAKSEQQRVKRGTSPRPPEGGLGYSQLVGDTITKLPVLCLKGVLYMWNSQSHLYSIVWLVSLHEFQLSVKAKTTTYSISSLTE